MKKEIRNVENFKYTFFTNDKTQQNDTIKSCSKISNCYKSMNFKGLLLLAENWIIATINGEIENIQKEIRQSRESNVAKCIDSTLTFRNNTDSTRYEEIVGILQRMNDDDDDDYDDDDNDYDNNDDFEADIKPHFRLENVSESQRIWGDIHNNLFSKETNAEPEMLMRASLISEKSNFFFSSEDHLSPRLDELMNKNHIELAHTILFLQIQIEDQKKGIKLLREALIEMKKKYRTMDLNHQETLKKANVEAENLIKRHQKFIKQLLNEKKILNETVTKLLTDFKLEEEKFKKSIKAIQDRHLVEIKRARDAQATADKIKREKWIERKTLKIKEMTIKGLEPELSNMVVRQHQEIIDLKSLHRAELEEVELKAARRTTDLMNQLREELTKEKINAIDVEINEYRAKMERDFEEERKKLEIFNRKLQDQIGKKEENIINEKKECRQKIIEQKRESDKEKEKMIRDFHEEVEDIRRQHVVEMKKLEESLEVEKEAWISNNKKQEAIRFLEKEAELRQQYKKERDRDIEAVIEMLEMESAKLQAELNEVSENKIKSLRNKFENEIKEAEANETALKNKLTDVKSQLLEKEELITAMNSQMKLLQAELMFIKRSCEEMTSKRHDLENIVRKEFEQKLSEKHKEKEDLVQEIKILKKDHMKELAKKEQLCIEMKNEMQMKFAKVYSRIKTALNKKEIIIESLRKENKGTIHRCRQLELLLETQRRNLLLY